MHEASPANTVAKKSPKETLGMLCTNFGDHRDSVYDPRSNHAKHDLLSEFDQFEDMTV